MREVIGYFRNEPRITIPFVAIIIGFTAWPLVDDLGGDEQYPDYYEGILPYVLECDLQEPWKREGYEVSRSPLKWSLHCISFNYLGSPTFLNSIFGIGLMPLVYILGTTITKDRIIGLLALIMFTQNPLYTDWVTSGTYDMAWAFFVIASVIMIYKHGFLTPIGLLVAAFGFKSMTLLYIPPWLYSLKNNDNRFWILGLLFGGVGFGACMLYSFGMNIETLVGNSIGFYPENIEQALFRNISLLWQVIPALMLMGGVAAYLRPKNGIKGKREMVFWLIWIILTTPIIHLFTQQLTFSYRFTVFAVFMSIFGSMVLVDAGNFIVEQKLKIKPKIS